MAKTFITLLSTENYLKGVLVLNASLKKTGTKYPFTVILSDRISKRTENILKDYQISTIRIPNSFEIEDLTKINQTGPTHWNYTFEKLHIFNLTQFDKIVFLDSDMLILENIDELFEKKHMSAVGPAGGKFPGNEHYNGLNSGLLVVEPNQKDFESLISLIPVVTKKLEQCGDQDVIIEHFITDWRKMDSLHLDDRYNMIFPYIDYYAGRFKYTVKAKNSNKNIKVVHFIGRDKPWMQSNTFLEQLKLKAYAVKSKYINKNTDNQYYYKVLLLYKGFLNKFDSIQ